VTLDPVHCLAEQVAGFCSSHDVSAPVVCRSSQLATVLELVGAGAGVSIVPTIAGRAGGAGIRRLRARGAARVVVCHIPPAARVISATDERTQREEIR
jgi:DNA-binding transcriptional LysR family regulator